MNKILVVVRHVHENACVDLWWAKIDMNKQPTKLGDVSPIGIFKKLNQI
jgi:hypothetical protein